MNIDQPQITPTKEDEKEKIIPEIGMTKGALLDKMQNFVKELPVDMTREEKEDAIKGAAEAIKNDHKREVMTAELLLEIENLRGTKGFKEIVGLTDIDPNTDPNILKGKVNAIKLENTRAELNQAYK